MPLINETIIGGVNARDATATSADILQGKTAVVGKELITGTMKDNSGKLVTGSFDSGGSNYIRGKIPEDGHYDASSVLQVPVSNLVSGNIRSGVNIGGVVGSYSGGNLSFSAYGNGRNKNEISVYSPHKGYTIISIGGTQAGVAKSENGIFTYFSLLTGLNNGYSISVPNNSSYITDGGTSIKWSSYTLTRSSFVSSSYTLDGVVGLVISC